MVNPPTRTPSDSGSAFQSGSASQYDASEQDGRPDVFDGVAVDTSPDSIPDLSLDESARYAQVRT